MENLINQINKEGQAHEELLDAIPVDEQKNKRIHGKS